MIYIQIPDDQDAAGFLALAKSGLTVSCFPDNTYGVRLGIFFPGGTGDREPPGLGVA